MTNPKRTVARCHAILGACLAATIVVAPQTLFAAPSCSFTSVTSVSFGVYNVFAAFSNKSGVGSLTIRCQGGGSPSFVVSLSTGQSNTYASRVMKSGANSLNYNLYINAARTAVWGDGTGGSSTATASPNGTTNLDIFGRIPAGQDVGVGVYGDNLVATVYF